jgi:molybdenum cofactor biosynthesis protein B
MRELVVASGHRVHADAIVPDEPAARARSGPGVGADAACDVIVSSGARAFGARPTVESVDRVFEIRIDGFGELFRLLSFEEIGARRC